MNTLNILLYVLIVNGQITGHGRVDSMGIRYALLTDKGYYAREQKTYEWCFTKDVGEAQLWKTTGTPYVYGVRSTQSIGHRDRCTWFKVEHCLRTVTVEVIRT